MLGAPAGVPPRRASSSRSPACARGARAILADGAEIVDDSVAVLEGQRVAAPLPRGRGRAARRRRAHAAPAREGAAQGGRARRRASCSRSSTARSTSPARSRRGRARRRRRRARRSGSRSRREYRDLLAHDPGTRRGDDPEDLHQLRVATRRLRAFLRAARPLVDHDWAESLRDGARLARRPPRAGARPRRHARSGSGPRSRRSARTARARPGCSRRSRRSERPPIGMSSRRSTATATTRSSTGSRRRPRRRCRATTRSLDEDLQARGEADAQGVRGARRRLAGRGAARRRGSR